MARKQLQLPFENHKCVTTQVGEYNDTWCMHHAAYLLDCLWCGKNFHSSRPHTRYCSCACKQSAYRDRVNKRSAVAGGA